MILKALHKSALHSSFESRLGAVTLEFALIAPVVVAFFMGMFELGRAVMVKETLDNAARNGAKMGTMPGKTNTDVLTEIVGILQGKGLPTGKATVTVKVNDVQADVSTASAGDKISVSVAIPAKDVTWTGTFYQGSAAITSESTVMRKLG